MAKLKLLLHTCCAPCSAFLVKQLAKTYAVTVYFTNDNIDSQIEYDLRLKEARKYFVGQGTDFISADYRHADWLEFIRGLEAEPEKGRRCNLCYAYRLKDTAKYAKRHGYDLFASTLSISPHKLADQINQIGMELEDELGVKFLAGDFKKQDGFKNAMAMAKQYGFYRQNYCGCEFSR